ncbi:MAG: TIGR02281 family clan AA aspartic protease [Sphingomicrobium sp.]
MIRFAALILLFGTLIGTLMPSSPRNASLASANRGDHDQFFTGPEFDGGGARPASSNPNDPGVTLERSDDGHFYADAEVNGTPVHFLIDTGATGIALARDDAERAAVPLNSGDSQTIVGRGAAGDVMGQNVTLDRVALGGKEVREASAVMVDGGDQSLLGQSFLSEFGSVEIHGDTMVLR